MTTCWRFSFITSLVLCVTASAQAQTGLKLLGFTGNQSATFGQQIFEIDPSNASSSLVRNDLSIIRDSNAIGWNPMDSELYRIGGQRSYRSDPTHGAYRDTFYMAGIDVYDYATGTIKTNGAINVKFNANPPPAENPDPITGDAVSGLPGPFPDWILPNPRRTQAQTDDSYKNMEGPNEWKTSRDILYSGTGSSMYVIGESGLYEYTPVPDPLDPGSSQFIGQLAANPATGGNEAREAKGAALFHPQPGQTQLLVGLRNEKSEFNVFDYDIVEMDQTDGQVDYSTARAIKVVDSGGNEVRDAKGILALATNPDTGDLFGIEYQHLGNSTQRALLKFETFDSNGTLTGNALEVGILEVPDNSTPFNSLAFVGYRIGDMERDGDVDFDDIPFFVDALTNPDDYKTLLGVAARVSGDTDGDGDHDFDDIPGFVALLQGPLDAAVGVPEPSSLALVGAALLGLLGYGWRRRR